MRAMYAAVLALPVFASQPPPAFAQSLEGKTLVADLELRGEGTPCHIQRRIYVQGGKIFDTQKFAQCGDSQPLVSEGNQGAIYAANETVRSRYVCQNVSGGTVHCTNGTSGPSVAGGYDHREVAETRTSELGDGKLLLQSRRIQSGERDDALGQRQQTWEETWERMEFAISEDGCRLISSGRGGQAVYGGTDYSNVAHYSHRSCQVYEGRHL